MKKIDDSVKHTFREHNQEADRSANLELKERRRSHLKVLRILSNGKRHEGTAMEAKKTMEEVDVDREKWITIIETAVPLETCTAMAAAFVWGMC